MPLVTGMVDMSVHPVGGVSANENGTAAANVALAQAIATNGQRGSWPLVRERKCIKRN